MTESIHHLVCKGAWIDGAIKSSAYRVQTDQHLTFWDVERWCCETRNYVFVCVKLLLLLKI